MRTGFIKKSKPNRGNIKRKDAPVSIWTKAWDKTEQPPTRNESGPCLSGGHNCGQRALKRIAKLRIINIKYFFFM
jgi:hypothetical protein